MDLVIIGAAIRMERQKIGMTQQRLADLAGLSKGRIEALENGRTQDMGFQTVIGVLVALGFRICIAK